MTSILIFLGAVAPTMVWGVEEEARHDSVAVDSLESHLSKHGSELPSMTKTGERKTNRDKVVRTLPKRSQRSGISTVEGEMAGVKKLNQIGSSIANLEHDIETLSAKILAIKQKVVDQAGLDNEIFLDVKVNGQETIAVQTMKLSIDGFEVFDFRESESLWTASDTFPIYHGPLGRGNHRIDISARVVMKMKEPLPLNESAFRLVNNSFSVDIPDGKFQRKWIIEISTVTEGNGLNVSLNESG